MLSQIKLLLGITDNLKDNLLNLLIKIAKDKALRTLYPFEEGVDFENLVFPIQYNYWLVSAVQQMYQALGSEIVKSYSENGLSITYKDLQGSISKDLISELVPKAKALY